MQGDRAGARLWKEHGRRAEPCAAAFSRRRTRGFRLEAVEAVVTSSLTTTGKAAQVAPNVLSIAHWERILEGELYAATARIDWRTLLQRTLDTDLRVCVRCGSGRAKTGRILLPERTRTRRKEVSPRQPLTTR